MRSCSARPPPTAFPPRSSPPARKWLGTTFDRPGEVEGPRVQLTSVPYTLRAADADTLGGRPASAYLLAPTSSDGQTTESAAGSGPMTASASGQQPSATPQAVLPGTVNFLAKYVTAADVGDSAVFENLGRVGIGTANPLDLLHVRFTNTNGTVTGYAVQNLGNTPTSYSGMLFYDQNGILGQFQGFNNVTHEYRINNIAKNGGAFFDGSINFMIGGTSKFFVSPISVGIGTTSPSPTSNLDISNAIIRQRHDERQRDHLQRKWVRTQPDRKEGQRHAGGADGGPEQRRSSGLERERIWGDRVCRSQLGQHFHARLRKLDGYGAGVDHEFLHDGE